MIRPFDWLGAYLKGYRNGQLDRSLGIRSRYASTSFSTDPDYVQEYSRGYNRGVLGLPSRP